MFLRSNISVSGEETQLASIRAFLFISLITDLYTVSDAILLWGVDGKHSKNCSKCTGKVKRSIPNKSRVIDVTSI